MASGTMISRILGIIRVALIAFILGQLSRQVDMLTLATSVPNSLYILFAGGALNTVLVPQIVRAIKNDADGGEAYTNRIMTAFMLIIGAVAIVATVAAPLVSAIYTSSEWREPALASQYQSLIALTYLTLPQIFFYGAFFLLGQVLNARDKFGPMMWAPIANNVISIAVLSIYLVVWGNDGDHGAAFTTPQVLLLGLGSTAGIAVQTLVLLPFVKKVGFKLRPRFDLKGTGLGKTFSLTKWTMGFVAINQIALVVVNRLATSATAGGQGAGVAVYSNAHLMWILPHSLITVSLATAMLPNASRLAAAGDKSAVAQEFTKTVRLALIAIVPATAAFLALAGPIAGFLFGHGSSTGDAIWVAWALMAFAVGLIPFTIQFVCLRTFYAMEDTRTPFFLQVLIAGLNIGLAFLLVWWVNSDQWVASALALAYSLAYLVGVFVSWQVLRRRLPDLAGSPLVMHLVRLLLGAIPGAIGAYYLSGWLVSVLGTGKLALLAAAAAGGIVILASFLLVGKLLKVRELASISTLVSTRFGKRRQPKAAVAPSTAGKNPDDEFELDDAAFMPPAGISDSDLDDIGPVTVIRNRPPVSRHNFERPAASLDDADASGSSEPSRGWDAADGEASFDEASLDQMGFDETTVGGRSADEDAVDHSSFANPAAQYSHDEVADDSGGDDSEELESLRIHSGLGTAQSVVLPAPIDLDEDGEDDEETTGRIDMRALFREGDEQDQIATVGTLLNTRYELIEKLAVRRGTETWRAHDQVLSRDVAVHVVAPGDPRISELIQAARKGAAATDSRFLRVLDANEVTDATDGIGAYVVAEFAQGKSLTKLLAKGPLSTLEAGHIVRELADALVGVHAQGLFHEQVNPDNVIITQAGAVRLVGFGIEAALARRDDESNAWSARERADVEGLGKVLYAALVRHWPGEAKWGLPAAPIIAGETAPPHTVKLGVSPALDRICTTTLTERGSMGERRITTASQIYAALTEVLGTANASADLESRVRSWVMDDDKPVDAPVSVAPLATPDPATTRVAPAIPAASAATPAAPRRAHDDDAPAAGVAVADREQRPRYVLWAIGILAALALVISLVINGINNAADNEAATPGTSGTAAPGEAGTSGAPGSPSGSAEGTGAITIVSAKDFDPEADNGNAEENPDQVARAIDGDPATGWQTLRYLKRPNMGGLKPGVGLVLDLGEERQISAADLILTGDGTAVELRVPTGDTASMRTEADWEIVASNDKAAGNVTLTLDEPVTTRYALVYFTNLPPVEGGFRAQLNEITLR